MAMLADLFLNMLIIALLSLTIGTCWVLNKRIRVLQDSKSELAELLKHFDESTQRAADSIIALQTASKKIGDTIQTRIEKANYLADDLAFLIEKSGRLASEMEAGLAVTRAKTRVMAEPRQAGPRQAEPDEPEIKSEKQAKIIEEKTGAFLESLLERVSGRTKPASKTTVPKLEAEAQDASAKSPARTRAEQELLDMIRAGMKG